MDEVGILQRLKGWLTASKRPVEGLGNPDLHPIDIEALTRDLNLLSEARELGQKGLPSPDATMLAGAEADIVRAIERHRQGNADWAVRRLATLSESLSKCHVDQEVNQARKADEEFARKANSCLADFEALLKTSSEDARNHQEELEYFKAENRLKRQSRHHSKIRGMLNYLILLLVVVIEGGVNAGIFATGLDSGLIGGWSYAMLFAAGNVVLAFVIGKFLVRETCHINWFRKLLGCLGLALGFASIGFMALLTAHFRDSLAAEAENAAAAAWASLWKQPLAFADVFSVLLAVLSVAFGIFALWKGLYSDERYPGYGTVSRRASKSLHKYEADLGEAREELENLKIETIEYFENALSRSQGVVASFQNIVEDKRTTASRLATAMLDADHSLTALLRRFRTENEKYRGDAPRPRYFDEYPQLPPVPLPNFDVQPDLVLLTAQRTMVEALLSEAEEIRARIQTSFSQQFDSLKTLDANFAQPEAS